MPQAIAVAVYNFANAICVYPVDSWAFTICARYASAVKNVGLLSIVG